MRDIFMAPFISLCMIVKNEEKVLKRCLDSVKGVVDEIVIVDTGSTDKTKEIALQYVDHVYDFEWTDSFADARNFAQSKASGQWILVMDADEYVDPNNLQAAIDEIKNQYDAFEVKIYNFSGMHGERIIQHHGLRIYKNNPAITFSRTIHEQLRKSEGELKVGSSSLILYHSGYLASVVKEKNKNKRNQFLLEKEMSFSENNAFDYFNLGNEYQSQGDTEKALEAYLKAYQNKPDLRYSWVSFCVVQIINCLITLQRYKDALNVISDAEQIYSESPDFKCLKGIIYLDQHRYQDAITEFEELIDKQEDYQNIISSVDYLEYFPHRALGIIYQKEKNYEKSVYHFTKALTLNKYCNRSLIGLMQILTEREEECEIVSFINHNNLINNNYDLFKFIRLFISLSQFDIARHYAEQVDNGLIKEGFNIKLELSKGNTAALKKFIETRTLEQLNEIIKNGCIDIYDLILFCFELKDISIIRLIFNLVKEESIKQLMESLFTNNNTSYNCSKDILILVERTLQFNQLSLFGKLAEKIGTEQEILLPIAHLMYQYHYKKEAIQIYNNVDPVFYDIDTFVNLVEYYFEEGEGLQAKEKIITAISYEKIDYRLFKYALLLHLEFESVRDWDIDQITNIAFSYYTGSQELAYLYSLIKSDSIELQSNGSPVRTVGFFLETTFHYYVYESIINELLNKGINCHLVINDYFQEHSETSYMYDDLMEFLQNLDRNDIDAYTVSMIMKNHFKYDCMVSCYYSNWLNEIAYKQVRVMYGLAKDTWNFAWWNVFYDKILCYGRYDYNRLNIYNNCVIVGNPKFDKWFKNKFDNLEEIKEKFLIDENKKTILYAPTYGHLSSIDDWIDDIKELEKDYNIIIKMHHGTAFRESEQYRREKILHNFNNVTSDQSDLFSLFAISDFVISDNSGIIFDAILAEQNILLLNPTSQVLRKDGSNEVRIREKIINLEKGDDLRLYLKDNNLFIKQKSELFDVLYNLDQFRDGNSGSRAADEIISLINGEKSTAKENPFLYSLRKQIFGF
jgi:glycosyltransferase involved in cell wall biosynthesis